MLSPSRVCAASLVCAATVLGCADDGSQGRDDAASDVVNALVAEDAPVIVFAHPDAVGPDQVLTPYPFAELGIDATPVPIEAESWLFWIDDRPGATFVHPNRFVLVDRASGAMTVADQQTWPVLDGISLWATEAEYWDDAAWVHSSDGVQTRRAPLATPTPVSPDGVTCSGTKGNAIVIDGYQPGQSQQETFRRDAEDMKATFEVAGFDTSHYGPMGGQGQDGTNDRTSLERWFTQQAGMMMPGETLFVFLTGHGGVSSSGETVVGGVWENDLEQWLAMFNAGVEIVVVINGCHSGGMLDSLSCTADVSMSATSEALSSYGDLDVNETINPRDKGSEFVSSICGAMLEILTVPSEVERVAGEAAAGGKGFWEEFMEEAFEGSKELDEAVRRGITEPQIQTGAAAKVKPQPPTVEAPECTPTDDAEPTTPNPSSSCPDTGLADLEILGAILAGVAVLPRPCDASNGEPRGNEARHSDGVQTTTAQEDVDIYARYDWQGCYEALGIGTCSPEDTDAGERARTALGLTAGTDVMRSLQNVPCGSSEAGLTLCTDPEVPQTGDYYVLASVVDAPLPSGDTTFLYQYGFVFDSDGDASNNYQADPAFPNDFFADTDTWYVAAYDPSFGWSLQVTDARGGVAMSKFSGARVVVAGQALVLIVPANELPGGTVRYRHTAFRHTGDWGAVGPWSADVVPPVDEPLLTL